MIEGTGGRRLYNC